MKFQHVLEGAASWLRHFWDAVRVRVVSFYRRWPRTAWTLTVLLAAYAFCLPRDLFRKPVSAIIEDRNGNLLGARIAADGQWRFPQVDSVPARYAACLIAFEDRHFWWHPGVDPMGLARAVRQNVQARRVVSGGSTISMQVIRMAREADSRSIWQKIVEAVLATRLELRYSKEEILAIYASNAPFGGNVVGIEAASWRYFGKQPSKLTWAEAAVLAVLPNSPALIHPGRNRTTLLKKRNRLLDFLEAEGTIDHTTCLLAKDEPLPDAPLPLPRLAPHLLDRAAAEHRASKKARFRTTIDATLQAQVNEVVARHHVQLVGNDIHNLAAVVLDVETGDVLAYVGNAPAGADFGEQVDCAIAKRSTGSTLKPFLYAAMLHDGAILPGALVQDIPTDLDGYRPENFKETYDGLVSARRSLARSLNVPFVRMLQDYGLEKFHFQLKKCGLTSINRSPKHYGLTLILGGAETSLWELTGAYASMSRVTAHYYPYDGKYDPHEWHAPNYLWHESAQDSPLGRLTGTPPLFGAAACWSALDAMQEVERPDSEGNWEMYSSSRRVAWKTGTSLGFRDAWSIGTTPRYAVGVWVGNANGEGRPGLIGVEVAAPVMFDIFGLLPQETKWYDAPFDEMVQLPVCRQSGYRVGSTCPVDSIWVPQSATKVKACPYHQNVHLSLDGKFQVTADCLPADQMLHESWFVVPPVEEFYFRPKHPEYVPLPPFRSDCGQQADRGGMQIVYPAGFTRIYIPTELDGTRGQVVFQVAHRHADTDVFWHLDDEYVGTTRHFHELALSPPVGRHTLTVVDAKGYRISQTFEVMDKPKG